MGLLEGSDILYLNVTCGFLQNKKKEIKARGYTGILKDISRQVDDFEGKEINKIRLYFKDPEKNEYASISFTEDTWFSVSFFQRFENVDREKPFTVGVSSSDQNEKMSFCWMKQDGNKVEKGDIPMPEKKKVGNRDIYDYSAFLSHIDGILAEYKERQEKLAQNPTKIYDDDGKEIF